MEDQFFADTARLADHAVLIREERGLAGALRDKLQYLQQFCLPEEEREIRELTRKAQGLVNYFSSAADLVENMSWDFQRLSNEIARILQESSYAAGKLIE
jgi:hypothetical protein